MISFPNTDDYPEYFSGYVHQNNEGDDILATLANQEANLRAAFLPFSDRGDYRYAPEKWSVKEVLGHINDTERIFAYRLFRISRGDKSPLQGFNQDDYIQPGNFNDRSMEDLLAEFKAIRGASIVLAKSLDATALDQVGTASGVSVKAKSMLYIITGHVQHHLNLHEERYV